MVVPQGIEPRSADYQSAALAVELWNLKRVRNSTFYSIVLLIIVVDTPLTLLIGQELWSRTRISAFQGPYVTINTCSCGDRGKFRAYDTLGFNQMLYRLSYSVWARENNYLPRGVGTGIPTLTICLEDRHARH